MKDSRAEALRWLRQAKNDLGFARVALREGFFAQACFVAQQTAEKALKAVAYGLGERVVLGHSLVELLDQLGDRAPALARLRDGGGLLDQYYVTTRYPNSLPGGAPFEAFDRRQAEEAIARAAEFVDAARERIGASD